MGDQTHEQDESPTVAELGPATEQSAGEGADARATVLIGTDAAVGQARSAPAPTHVGRFRIVERIGQGGMGTIYAGYDEALDRQVAIKVLRTDLVMGASGRERLLREAQAIAKLSHPNVVHVYEAGRDEDRVFMAMELVRGPTLRQWCSQHARTWSEIVDVFLGAGAGLAAAHDESIIHRDFKPDNVIVADDGRPRVVDFGLARSRGGSSLDGDLDATEALESVGASPESSSIPNDLTATGFVMGTPAYMAPEQFEKREPDARTDQYAFCVALYEMLHGERPFSGSTYAELEQSILAGLGAIAEAGSNAVPRSVHAIVLRDLDDILRDDRRSDGY